MLWLESLDDLLAQAAVTTPKQNDKMTAANQDTPARPPKELRDLLGDGKSCVTRRALGIVLKGHRFHNLLEELSFAPVLKGRSFSCAASPCFVIPSGLQSARDLLFLPLKDHCSPQPA